MSPAPPAPPETPKTFREFLEAVKAIEATMGLEEGQECFYRAQADASWPLLPSLHRHASVQQVPIQALEASLFQDFSSRMEPLSDIDPPGWARLHLMQLGRIPTRLLDWSEWLGIALSFAVHRRGVPPETEAAIWMMNPYAFNKAMAPWTNGGLVGSGVLVEGSGGLDYPELFPEGVPWPFPLVVAPLITPPAMCAQRTWYTLHGSDPRPLEEQCPRFIARIPLPAALLPEAQEFLETAELTESVLFPGLDGVAMEVRRRHRLES